MIWFGSSGTISNDDEQGVRDVIDSDSAIIMIVNLHLGLTHDEQGVRDVIDSDDLFDSRPAINRAFHHCRKLAKV